MVTSFILPYLAGSSAATSFMRAMMVFWTVICAPAKRIAYSPSPFM
jgi:hypothetical protein